MARDFTSFIFSMLFEELLLSSFRSISYVAQRWPIEFLANSSADKLALYVLNCLFKFKYMVDRFAKRHDIKKIHLHVMRLTHATKSNRNIPVGLISNLSLSVQVMRMLKQLLIRIHIRSEKQTLQWRSLIGPKQIKRT